MGRVRFAKLNSLAKINLDLRVLNKRPDGFHELRTVFQTISLADRIEIELEMTKRTQLSLEGNIDIPDNLVLRAARAVLDAARATATVRFRLNKRIPMGGGLGGGSSNAAAVLLALPVLLRCEIPVEQIAANLGSDVSFFLHGGTAIALGRGTELYSIPDLALQHILVVSTGVHVSTAEAYRALGRGLTFTPSSNKINGFQEFVRALGESRRADLACAASENDFEAVVFRKHPRLKQIRAKLSKVAAVARMTGSGSAIFGIFESSEACDRARKVLERDRLFRSWGFGRKSCELFPARLVSRSSYQRLWRRQLEEHIDPDDSLWPPRSRYAR